MSEETTFGYELQSKQVRHYEINDLTSVRRALTANAQEYLEFEGIKEKSSVIHWSNIFRFCISSIGIFIFFKKEIIFEKWLLSFISFGGFFSALIAMLVNEYVQESNCVFFTGSGEVENKPNKKFAALNHQNLRMHLLVYPFSPQVKFIAEIIESTRLFRSPKLLVQVEKNVFYGKYFSSSGFFYPPALTKDIDDLIEELIQQIPQTEKKNNNENSKNTNLAKDLKNTYPICVYNI